MARMKLSHYRQTIRPKYRFATAQGGTDEKQTIVARIDCDGVAGFGECAPSTLYGQTLETSEAALDRMGGLLGDDPFAIGPILDRIIAAEDAQRAAISAVDSALYDWVGKKLGVPVWRLLGLAQPRKQTTFTIGVAEMPEIRVKVEEALRDGYDALKIKVGTEHDHEVLGLVRKHFDGPLILDANEAWPPAEAPGHVRDLAQYRPTILEQPVPKELWRDMRPLRDLRVAPIYADESCERPADVVRLHGYVDGVNIKFTKCGGIREGLKMIHLARGLGMGTMLGCFVSSGLAIAPALALAGLVDFIDLDGHLLLAQDPWPGIGREGGTIFLPDAPGLGVAARG